MPARQDRRHDRDPRLNNGAESAAALEPSVRVETPEGIELELQPAGLHARGCAWLLDLLMRASVVYIVAVIAGLPFAANSVFVGPAAAYFHGVDLSVVVSALVGALTYSIFGRTAPCPPGTDNAAPDDVVPTVLRQSQAQL